MSEREFVGSKRRRIYKRRFDYQEAFARFQAGETRRQLARHYGVSVDAIDRAVYTVRHGDPMRPANAEDLVRLTPNQDLCPTCQGPKQKDSEMCWSCRQDIRLAPMQVKAGSRRWERMILADAPLGSLVRVKGRWGVVEAEFYGRDRAVYFWDGPAEYVSATEVVDVQPRLRVIVEGEEQESEAVA